MPEFEIKTSPAEKIYFFLLRWLNQLLFLLSLRKTRKFWGVVYDSVSKQPLDPVIVKLLYAEGGEPAQTCVTDLAGRYGFLAQPGKFKIFAKKSNYIFPSSSITGSHDGIFTDIYRGEFFQLNSESEVVGPNIPMDPLQFDWNQQAKQKVLRTYPFFSLFLKKLVAVAFWFGFVWSLVFVLKELLGNFSFPVSNYPQIVFLIYLGLLSLNLILPELRLWGRLVDKNGQPVTGAVLELINPVLTSVIFAKGISQTAGRFLLRANPGPFNLRITYHGQSATKSIRVLREGVFNLTVRLVDK